MNAKGVKLAFGSGQKPTLAPKRRPGYRLLIVIVVPMVGLLLAGCGPNPGIFARDGSSGLEVLLCEVNTPVTKLEIEAELDSSHTNPVWTAEGDALDLPIEVSLGVPPDDWRTTLGPVDMPEGTKWLRIAASGARNDYYLASFETRNLHDTQWLQLAILPRAARTVSFAPEDSLCRRHVPQEKVQYVETR